MKFTESTVTTQKEILKRRLGGELFEEITLDSTAFKDHVCKAGNPIDATGKKVEHHLTTDYAIAIETLVNNNADVAFMGAQGYVSGSNDGNAKRFRNRRRFNGSNLRRSTTCLYATLSLLVIIGGARTVYVIHNGKVITEDIR